MILGAHSILENIMQSNIEYLEDLENDQRRTNKFLNNDSELVNDN